MGLSGVRPIQIAVLAAVLFLPTKIVWGQEALATLRGKVLAHAGTPLSGAKVTAKNRNTGLQRTSSTDEQGQFEIPRIPAGGYEVQAARSGFVAQTQNAVALETGQTLNLEFVLEPGTESSSAAASRISESQLVGLPLNGRSYNQLATLQAGVSDPAGEQSSRGVGGGNLTVAGGRPTSNNFLLDGTNIMDTGNRVPRSAAGVQLGSDAVFQVQVFSTNYGAEYGRGSGGTLNSITSAGTSQFHGTLFEYFRNSKLDAPNFFDSNPLKPDEKTPPPFKRNQFGFSVTGPVRKERTFFSTSFEAMRDRLTTSDFTFLPDANVHRGIITDSAGNVLRSIPVSPQVAPYLALYPLPNLGSIGGGIGRHSAPVFLPTNENYWTARLDQKISDHDSLFGRYTFDDATSTDTQSLFLFRSVTNSRQQYVTLVETHIFSIRTLNSFRMGYTRPVDAIDTISSIDIPRSLYFVPAAPQFGQIEIPGLPAFGPAFTTPEGNVMNSFQFADDVVAQRGPHALKFGVEAHRYRWDVFNGFTKGGVWSFNSLESMLQGGGEGTNLQVALPGSDNHKAFRQTLVGLYLQDNYRFSSRLQFNLGLRYEVAGIITEKDHKLAFLADTLKDTTIQIGSMLKDNPTMLDFSPRLGFSWAPWDGKSTTLSGGFGIYYDPLFEYVIDLQKNSAPFTKRVVRTNFDSSTTFPNAIAGAAGLTSATPFQVEVLDYHHIQTPRVLRYNLALQQTLAGGWRAQATYVGARGNHLFRGYEANLFPLPITRADGSLFFPPDSGPLNPAFGAIALTGTDAQSFYNSFQISASKSPSHGISLQANYSYNRSVDDTSSFSSGASAAATRQYPYARTLDRALSDFDIRHRFSVNYFYSLPAGKGQPWLRSGALSHVLGGWRVGGIVQMRTGTPFHPLVNVRVARFLFTANRPNLIAGKNNNPVEGVTAGCKDSQGQTIVAAGRTLGGPDLYFDPCSFAIPEPGTLGNVGRNTMIGPKMFTMDLSLQKEIVLGGERRLQFRAELFNLLDRNNFASPSRGSSVIFSGAFPGRPNATAGTIVRTITTSRQVQFALRFSF